MNWNNIRKWFYGRFGVTQNNGIQWQHGDGPETVLNWLTTPENIQFIGTEWLRSLTAKPPRNATQSDKNIYRHACALLAALEEEDKECLCAPSPFSSQLVDMVNCPIHR